MRVGGTTWRCSIDAIEVDSYRYEESAPFDREWCLLLYYSLVGYLLRDYRVRVYSGANVKGQQPGSCKPHAAL